jgi:hypothetical protein
MSRNSMIGLAFKTMAKYLIKLEDSPEEWHLAPIQGHTRIYKLFPFYPVDITTLETQRIVTVSQLFETQLSGRIDKTVSSELISSLTHHPALQHKIKLFVRAFSQQTYHNKFICPRSNLAVLINQDTNPSADNISSSAGSSWMKT